MTLSEELLWRGLIKDTTFQDVSWLDTPKTFYLGADVGSANSLTIGNLAVFLLARRLLDAGWHTVLLVGGATSLIGDPGGKESERELVSREQVEENKRAISMQVQRLFADKQFTLVDNYNWFQGIGYLEFLRDVGKQFSMTELLQRDFIAARLGEGAGGISYAEFSYSLIQGYDFWHLYKQNDVVLQIGGSDQWGNMLSGVPLVRKKEGAEVHALSMPLVINKATGKKFGKSEYGAVWLDDSKTTVYQFYQFWINVDDVGVHDYLKIYTLLDKDTIEDIMQAHQEAPSGRLAQKHLAYEVTKLVHGQSRAEAVRDVSEVLFGGQSYESLSPAAFSELESELRMVAIGSGTEIAQFLVDGGLASSKGEARRFLDSNAIYINGQQIPLEKRTFDAQDFLHGYAVVRRGKNQTVLAKLSQS